MQLHVLQVITALSVELADVAGILQEEDVLIQIILYALAEEPVVHVQEALPAMPRLFVLNKGLKI